MQSDPKGTDNYVKVCAIVGGAVLGTIGFAGGYIGPVILAPDANQGPLLGIFITGPLGFLLGLMAGAGYGLLSRSNP